MIHVATKKSKTKQRERRLRDMRGNSFPSNAFPRNTPQFLVEKGGEKRKKFSENWNHDIKASEGKLLHISVISVIKSWSENADER